MNKGELVAAVAEKSSLNRKDAEKAVEALFECIESALMEGDRVQMVGFGTFEVRERPARKGRNPRTNEEIDIPASKAPAFKPGKLLKDAVNR
jgi:DNA-binding protein HU-beta